MSSSYYTSSSSYVNSSSYSSSWSSFLFLGQFEQQSLFQPFQQLVKFPFLGQFERIKLCSAGWFGFIVVLKQCVVQF